MVLMIDTSKNGTKKLVPEGVEGRVAYKGIVADTIIPINRWI